MVPCPGPVLTVASLNLHAGVDERNVPFDVVGACAALDADVVVLQEVWWPAGGRSQAALAADALGYRVHWATFGTGRRFPEPEAGGERIGRWTGRPPAVVLDRRDGRGGPGDARGAGGSEGCGGGRGGPVGRRGGRDGARGAEPGRLGLAVLSRLPARPEPPIVLRALARDGAARSALAVVVGIGGAEVTVVGVHMAHLSQGSVRQYADLRRRLPGPGRPAVVAGDMNLWGPAVVRLLPGWRRAVTGRSWPAHHPISQPDHILFRGGVRPVEGRTLAGVGSDHRPVRAALALA